MSGLVAATFMGAASALGNLSLEAILKHSMDGSQGVEQSIWLQNLVLYCYTASFTLLLWVLDVSMDHAHKSLFHGWDGKTWILLLFQVCVYRHVALPNPCPDHHDYHRPRKEWDDSEADLSML